MKPPRAFAILTVFGISGLVLATVCAAVWPRRYMSAAILQFHFSRGDPLGSERISVQDLSAHLARWKELAFSDDYVREFVGKYRLYTTEPMDRRIKKARRDMAVNTTADPRDPRHTIVGTACCYELGFVNGDPLTAQRAAVDMVQAWIETTWKYNRDHFPSRSSCSGDCDGTGFAIVDAPSTLQKYGPDARLLWIAWPALGLILGSLFAWRRRPARRSDSHVLG
jgi:hypothetical protein